MDAVIQGVIKNIDFWTFILILVLADLFALLVFWICLKSANTNIRFFRRMTIWRFNCLALLYEEFKSERLSGLSQEAALKEIKKKYKNNSLPFMLHSENRTFMGGHTYTVRNHFHQDLVLFNLWQFKFVHPKVIGPVQPDCRYFHNTLPDLIRFRQLLFSKQFTLVHKIIVSKVLIIVSTVFILVNYCDNNIYILFFLQI